MWFIHPFVFKNHNADIKEIAEALKISYESTQYILVDVLGVKRVATRPVEKAQNAVQKKSRDLLTYLLHNTHHYWLRDMGFWKWRWNCLTIWRGENKPKPWFSLNSSRKVKRSIRNTVLPFFRRPCKGIRRHNASSHSNPIVIEFLAKKK